MNYATLGRAIVTLGFCLGGLILFIYGLSVPVITVALACVAASIWLPWQLGLNAPEDTAKDYQLELLARLDDRNPEIHHQAENERELRDWQKSA